MLETPVQSISDLSIDLKRGAGRSLINPEPSVAFGVGKHTISAVIEIQAFVLAEHVLLRGGSRI